jgi:hypothetical protein
MGGLGAVMDYTMIRRGHDWLVWVETLRVHHTRLWQRLDRDARYVSLWALHPLSHLLWCGRWVAAMFLISEQFHQELGLIRLDAVVGTQTAVWHR